METEDIQKSLVGGWRKITATGCSEIYPDHLEFREHGLYSGKRERRAFTWWDAGTYRVQSEDEIKISTADDALVIYKFTLSGNILRFRDKEGCEFLYQRVA